MSAAAETLTPQRRFVTPLPDETVDRIKSWNLHIYAMRRPAGLLTGSDIVFVEPPRG